MRISLSTNWNSSRHATASDMLREILELGFDSVELGYSLTGRQAEEVSEWVQSERIHVSSVHAFSSGSYSGNTGPEIFNIVEGGGGDETRRGIEAVKQTAEFAYSMGAGVVVLHAGRVPIKRHVRKLESVADKNLLGTKKHHKTLQRLMKARDRRIKDRFNTLCESVNELLPYFEKLGIILALENLPTYDAIPNEPEMQMLLDSFPSPFLGYWHDCGHGQVRHNLGILHHEGIVSRFADRIVGLHLHDVIYNTSDHHMPPVEGGTVNFKMFKFLAQKSIPFVLEPARGASSGSIKRALEFLCAQWDVTSGN